MPRNYGGGALACIAASIAVASIIYGLGLIPLNLWHTLAWVFGPLGAYTVVYALVRSREPIYHLIWGVIALSIAIASTTYNILNPLVVLGSLILVVVVISLIRYWGERS